MYKEKKFTSIRNKFSKYLLLLSTIPLLIVGIFSGVLFFTALENSYKDFADIFTNQIGEETDDIFKNAFRVQEQIVTDFSIQQALLESSSPELSGQTSIDSIINSRLDSMQKYTDNIYEISIIGENDIVYTSGFHVQLFDNLQATNWYNEIINSDKPIWFPPHTGSYVGNSNSIPLLTIGAKIDDVITGKTLGVVVVDIDMFDFQYIYNKNFLSNGYVFLLDENNNPLVTSDMLNNNELKKYNELINSKAENYMYSEKKSIITNYTTLGIVSYDNIYRITTNIVLLILGLTLLLGVVAIFLSKHLAKNISRPITKLTDLMTSAQTGNLNVQMKVTSNDEIGILSSKFNEMIQEINHYTRKEIEDIKKLQKSELAALQSQINPHFLYNTLDSIIWMTRTGSMEDVIKMVTSLTTFFRISLSKGIDIISIEKEKQHLESYLTIQSMRYSSILSYSVNIQAEFYEYNIPKLLLQPLVENAIYHGIKLTDKLGFINIYITQDSDNIYIHIDDTGTGMNNDELEKLNEVCRTTQGKHMNSYGVVNVSRRMQILFGEKYHPIYESKINEGTKVIVPIPKQWEATSDE